MAQDKPTVAGDIVRLGPLDIPTETLQFMPPVDVNARGIVLSNERIKVLLPSDNGHTLYTVSLYVQREPLDDGEAERVTKAAAERDAKKADRDDKERLTREREIKRAQDIAQEALISALDYADRRDAQNKALLAKLGR